MSKCSTCRIKIDSKRVSKPKLGGFTGIEYYFICESCQTININNQFNYCPDCGVKLDKKHMEKQIQQFDKSN